MTKMLNSAKAGKPERRKKSSADMLGPNTEIGRKLKQYYDDLVSDDVPTRFADLLSRLEEAEPADPSAKTGPTTAESPTVSENKVQG